MSLDDTSASRTPLIAITVPPGGFHLRIFFIHYLLWLDGHVDNMWCRSVFKTSIFVLY